MTKVTFIVGTQRKTVEGPDGQTILQIALDNGIPMEHACGGNGFCTTCMCQVQSGKELLNERNDREDNMGITSDPYRLSCQARVQPGEGEVVIEVNEG